MTPKFEPGEIVIYIGHPNASTDTPFKIGDKIKIDRVVTGQDFGLQHPGMHYYAIGEWHVGEPCLQKLPPPNEHQKRFHDSLKPCDQQFPAQLGRWLNPAPTEQEARRIHPSLGEINKRREVFSDLYTRLQPFDHFCGGYDD